MTPEQYWQSNQRLQHITPPGDRWPEVGLGEELGKWATGTVFEFGCGDGRLSPFFDTSNYIGYDINKHALKAARANNPLHSYTDKPQQADTVLAYTVLVHVPDSAIMDVIDLLKGYKRIIIGEIMGRKWRRDGLPPVFNRERQEYIDMIGRPHKVVKVWYSRYNCYLDLLIFDEAFA